MKKNIFKKIVASLATVAMAAGLFTAMPAEEAKAAETKLFVNGDFCGWNWDKCGVLTSTDNETYVGDIVTLGDTKVAIKTVANWEKDEDKVSYVYNGSETQETIVTFAEAGKYEMKYVKSTKAISFTLKTKLEITDSYYVAGVAALGGLDWDTAESGKIDVSKGVKMTKDGDKYTLETKVTKDGDYEFCIIKYSVANVDGVDPTTTWLNDKAKDANFSATGLKAGKVKFEFDSADGTCKVTQVSVDKKEDPTDSTQSTGETGTKGNTETTTAADKTTTKTPETTTEAKKGIEVEVTLSADAKWDKVFIYAFPEGEGLKAWPGVEMTAKDGKWYATLDTTATKLSYVISNGNGEQTVDVKDVEGQNVKITLGAKNAEGKFEASAKAVAAGGTGSAKPGDAAPIVMMFAVAAVAAGMVVASKKKTICE